MTKSLDELTAQLQNEVEYEFATIVNQYPQYALQQCGWLDGNIVCNSQVRKYWMLLKERMDMGLDDDNAAAISLQAILEAGIEQEIRARAYHLPENATPLAYAQEISRRSYLTQTTASLSDLWKFIQAGDDIKVKEIVEKMSEYGEIGAPTSITSLSDIAESFAVLVGNGQRCIETFIPPIDTLLGGLERQTETILAARPSMGKTARALQIARNVAESGKKVLFFSLEMSAVSLWARIACPLVNVTWRDVLANRLHTDVQNNLKQKSAEIAGRLKNNLIVIDTRQTSESIWRTVSTIHPDLVVIDHLRFVKDVLKGENENKRQGKICEALHDLAKAYDLAVLLLVQLNRGVESRGTNDKRPQLADMRDSGEIEETADNVLMIYRDSYYNPPTVATPKDPTELWIRKFRNGPSGGKINLLFDKQSEWFEANEINKSSEYRDWTDV